MRLGDLITPAKVERCGDREFPVLSMTMHDGIVLQADRFKKAIASKDQSTYKVVKPGQLVVGFPIDEGVLYVQGYDYEGIMSPAYNVWNVDTKQVDTRYLELALHGPQSMSFYKEKMRGTTARRRSLPAATLVELDIPVPERCDQVKVVNTLLGIRASITDMNSLVERLNELVKSRFVEMFGDVRTNEFGWPVKTFEELADLITDGEHATPKRQKEGIYLLSARNVKDHKLDLSDVDYIGEDEYQRIARRVVPQEGDVLISCSGTIGKCCVVPAGLKFQMVRSAALIRFSNGINPVYAEWLITSDDVQEQIKKSATQSSQANLFQGRIKKLCGIVPPLALQQEFAAFVQQVDKLKFETQQAIDKLQMLYDSLAQEYFGSE